MALHIGDLQPFMRRQCIAARSWSPTAVALAITLGCNESPCVIPPCAPPIAIDVAVSSPTAPTGIVGLTLTVADFPQSCQVAAITHCYVQGSAGEYELQLSAPGYVPVKLNVIVNGTQPTCGCARVDTKQLSVTMQATGT